MQNDSIIAFRLNQHHLLKPLPSSSHSGDDEDFE